MVRRPYIKGDSLLAFLVVRKAVFIICFFRWGM